MGASPRPAERRATVAIWLMALSVLAWVPGGFSRFVFAKLLVTVVACLFGALGTRHGRLPRRVVVVLIAGATVFVVAALAGGTPLASLLGRWPRYEGLPVLGVYAASAWLGARSVGLDVDRLRQLVAALAAMTWLLLVFSALDLAHVSPLGHAAESRDGSLLGNATDQGLVAMMAVAVLAGAWLLEHSRWLLASAAAGVATVAISGSRTSMALVVVVVVAQILADRRVAGLGSLRRVATATVATVVLLLAVALAVPVTRDRLTSLTTGHGRLLLWQLTGRMVLDHPFLGVGPSRFVDAIGGYETPAWIHWVGVRTVPDSPHDWILQLLVAGGVPLLLAGLALAAYVVLLGWRAGRERPHLRGCYAAALAYGIAMLVNFTIASSTCLAAFLAGVAIAVPASAAVAVWQRVAQAGAAGVATIALLLGCASEIELGHGYGAAAAGDLTSAVSDFDAARALRPGDGDVAMLASQSLAGLVDDGDRAAVGPTESNAEISLRRTPDTYASRITLAVAQIAASRFRDAETELDRTVALYPQRPDGYLQRGIARFELHRDAAARTDLERARRLEPHNRAALTLLRKLR